jgi:predicted DNA-binding transcriptional regulator AlpA
MKERPLFPSGYRPVPRRDLSRTEAAIYVGVSTTKFDQMTVDGRMPKPRRIDARRVWDIRALDQAFDSLPGGEDYVERNPWDEVYQCCVDRLRPPPIPDNCRADWILS